MPQKLPGFIVFSMLVRTIDLSHFANQHQCKPQRSIKVHASWAYQNRKERENGKLRSETDSLTCQFRRSKPRATRRSRTRQETERNPRGPFSSFAFSSSTGILDVHGDKAPG